MTTLCICMHITLCKLQLTNVHFVLHQESTCTNASCSCCSNCSDTLVNPGTQRCTNAAEFCAALSKSDEPVANVWLAVHHQSSTQFILSRLMANDAPAWTATSSLHVTRGKIWVAYHLQKPSGRKFQA